MTPTKVHDWRIDAREYARHESRRGRRHAFDTIDPRRAALVVVDLVPFFVSDNPYARAILPNVNRLAAALRSTGGTVTWVVPAAEPPSPARVEFLGPEVAETYRVYGGNGAVRDRLWPDLDHHDGDLTLEKSAASAFFPGRSPLPELLAERGVDTLVIAGAVTNVCVESTARDAATLGYRVVVAADATAAGTDAVHNASLHTIYRSFGDVRPTGEIVGLLTKE